MRLPGQQKYVKERPKTSNNSAVFAYVEGVCSWGFREILM